MALTQAACYRLLGLPEDAPIEEIRRAYRRLARHLHPDLAGGGPASDRFKEITAAYNLLTARRGASADSPRSARATRRPGPSRASTWRPAGDADHAAAWAAWRARARATSPADAERAGSSRPDAGAAPARDAGTPGADPTRPAAGAPDPSSWRARVATPVDPDGRGERSARPDPGPRTAESPSAGGKSGPDASGERFARAKNHPDASGERFARAKDDPDASGARFARAKDDPDASGERFARAKDDPDASGERFARAKADPDGSPARSARADADPDASPARSARAHAGPDASPARSDGAKPDPHGSRAETAHGPARAAGAEAVFEPRPDEGDAAAPGFWGRLKLRLRGVRPARLPGEDVTLRLAVDAETVEKGGERHLAVTRAAACPSCARGGDPACVCGGAGRVKVREKLRVNIPPGAFPGARLRLPGKGTAGLAGHPDGDLFLVLEPATPEGYRREGADLHGVLDVDAALVARGGTLHVRLPHAVLPVTVPAGTRPGTRFRLRGQGLPRWGGGERGDVFLRIAVG
jgi:DnaJ-class molecular chaperone